MPRVLTPLRPVALKQPLPATQDDHALMQRLQGLLQSGGVVVRGLAARALTVSGDLTVGGRLTAGSIVSPPLAGGIHGESYLASTTASIPNNALTTVPVDTVEGAAGGSWAASAYTVPRAGRYLVSGAVTWSAAVAANQYLAALLNGAEARRLVQSSASHFALGGGAVVRAGNGATLALGAFQASGAAATLLSGATLTYAAVTYLGPL